jgi:hypothetical protein
MPCSSGELRGKINGVLKKFDVPKPGKDGNMPKPMAEMPTCFINTLR